MRIVVARVRDFPPGERRIVEVGRRSIGVFRVGDRFYAINNHCPHQGGPLCLGRVAPWVTSDGPGQFRVTGDDALLACPWHGWEYDLATGQSFLGPGEKPVRAYAVEVASAAQLRGADPRPVRGRIPGPYRVETYPVRIERDHSDDSDEDYVVVDTSTSRGRR